MSDSLSLFGLNSNWFFLNWLKKKQKTIPSSIFTKSPSFFIPSKMYHETFFLISQFFILDCVLAVKYEIWEVQYWTIFINKLIFYSIISFMEAVDFNACSCLLEVDKFFCTIRILLKLSFVIVWSLWQEVFTTSFSINSNKGFNTMSKLRLKISHIKDLDTRQNDSFFFYAQKENRGGKIEKKTHKVFRVKLFKNKKSRVLSTIFFTVSLLFC